MTNLILEDIANSFSDNILSTSSVSGGDINQAIKIKLEREGEIFVKYNHSAPDDLFEKEGRGLALLRSSTDLIYIPEVLKVGKLTNGITYLALEYLEPKSIGEKDFEQLGRGLAQLHSVRSSNFGLDYDNYIGTLLQKNDYKSTFHDFYWEMRIYPQLVLAERDGKLNKNDIDLAYQSYKKWDSIFPNEKASLIHGDLWGGNVMNTLNKGISIIDPAVYYGHREIEIAFTMLFGGFSSTFYSAYNTILPLEKGFDERIELYHLYPILVHANLFGGHYVSRAKSIIKKYQ